jgi:urocanate hydratase
MKTAIITLSLICALFTLSGCPSPSAFNKVREESRKKVVINNLRQVAAGGQRYILEQGVPQVGYPTIVNAGMMPELQPIDGENYTPLVVRENGGTLQVTTASGQVISFEY